MLVPFKVDFMLFYLLESYTLIDETGFWPTQRQRKYYAFKARIMHVQSTYLKND
ncbi:hypothetical protein TOT_040000430 [Theileria orientalis strain Shintoku]|uniref:Uncharacterized protein n=1 Tax=Theileria orientalis strain Shintoku TaxID=869250 RepID=J4DQ93_THEOR|nr:hypothetical protein TOT_040000430 [Theileria orientalis strain Shintoku]BAM42054.1 hypothetical protein TOT_040000430 [Theileria orientalis strain Shintoku]|eukprot:XP_009692355.1 hypothetical protein TOT_040000430 [Theileria orientalis strain Shintoku]